ncbi:MAG: dihydrofolate reductase [Ignavibacteriae bacterium]|nr:MAG: dihydrofolate reductase [Ignavibacteriota bacterium]
MDKKIILYIASSLDGFIAKKDGDISWLFTDQDYGYTEFMNNIDSAVMGRKTYDFAMKYSNPPFPGIKNFVVTSQRNLYPSSTQELIFCSLDDVLNFIKSDDSFQNMFLVGGTGLIANFINNNLLTDIVVSIHPIILGDGIPLFHGIKSEVNLILKESKNFNSGLVQITYEVSS